MTELVTLLDRKEIGRVHNDARGRRTFVYDDQWRNAREAYPLSLSMPIAAKEHGRSVVEAFLWGLLPDNEQVLARWAAKFQVSARNVFALMSRVGEDCAGAVQLVTPERLEALRSGKEDKVEWNPKSPDACESCAKITPPGDCRGIPVSSALPAPNPKRHCFCKMTAGAFLPDAYRRRIF
ncbi:MAG: HipA N-terminal domain-containing protein [Bradyrhizobium sp.]